MTGTRGRIVSGSNSTSLTDKECSEHPVVVNTAQASSILYGHTPSRQMDPTPRKHAVRAMVLLAQVKHTRWTIHTHHVSIKTLHACSTQSQLNETTSSPVETLPTHLANPRAHDKNTVFDRTHSSDTGGNITSNVNPFRRTSLSQFSATCRATLKLRVSGHNTSKESSRRSA